MAVYFRHGTIRIDEFDVTLAGLVEAGAGCEMIEKIGAVGTDDHGEPQDARCDRGDGGGEDCQRHQDERVFFAGCLQVLFRSCGCGSI
ncbi:hypothetical protein D3C72_2412110 [compost metagenome]